MTSDKQELVLLGVWNQLPIQVWTWLNDAGVTQLEKLTGRRVGIFCNIENDLNYECFVKKDTDLLKQDLDTLSSQDQILYVQKITDDYYAQVAPLEAQIQLAQNQDPSVLSNEEIAPYILSLANAWLPVTMQIWYAVLLDTWYPIAEEKSELKSVIAKARDHCGHLHATSSDIEHVFYGEVAKRLGVSVQEIYYMTQPEIAKALRGNLMSKEVLALRIKNCVMSSHGGTVRLYEGEEAEKVKELYVVPTIGEKKDGVLKGTAASKGTVEGVARVILLDNEFSHFQEGEILVSLQTMVHYVPLMKKSKAILTEFGGLTSHAAIVSRELKKPCVVGISGLIASIKTGDRIEVDAEKGTVTKL